MSIFGMRLKKLRDIKGQSQEDVGKALGKSRETISKYEKGEREPGISVIASMANHFGVSSDYMLGLTDQDFLIFEKDSQYKIKNEISEFEPYLKNKNYIKYFRFAKKMADNNIDLEDLEKFIDNLILSKKKKRY
ncbi:MAG: helix-turn-helix domain-containing protein [Bacillota bacterium]|nr:helix-turn-helix domain-containing protein [Bacillota bacterium]